MSARVPAIDRDLPDGVYLDLEPHIYFAQDRLGSTDLIRLWQQHEGWWWSSRWNPDHVEDTNAARNYGSALHTITLEGLRVYEARHMVMPELGKYHRPLVTEADFKEAFADARIKLPGMSSFRKKEWVEAAKAHLRNRVIWQEVLDDFERRRVIRTLGDGTVIKRPTVTAEEDRMLRIMHDAAMEDDDIRMLLLGAEEIPSLAEVSFFWTDPDTGVKRRARFDKPVPSFTLDLKSLGNWEGRDLKHAVGDIIQRHGYDIQVGDQHDARLKMHHMIRAAGERCISGGTIAQRAWLLAIAERNLPFDWRWLFYQKPESRGRAPILFPVREAWAGPYHTSGYRKARRAVASYVEYIEHFGLGPIPDATGRPARPWARIEPLHVTQAVDSHPEFPIVTLPTWGWNETPVDGEDLHMARRI